MRRGEARTKQGIRLVQREEISWFEGNGNRVRRSCFHDDGHLDDYGNV